MKKENLMTWLVIFLFSAFAIVLYVKANYEEVVDIILFSEENMYEELKSKHFKLVFLIQINFISFFISWIDLIYTNFEIVQAAAG